MVVVLSFVHHHQVIAIPTHTRGTVGKALPSTFSSQKLAVGVSSLLRHLEVGLFQVFFVLAYNFMAYCVRNSMLKLEFNCLGVVVIHLSMRMTRRPLQVLLVLWWAYTQKDSRCFQTLTVVCPSAMNHTSLGTLTRRVLEQSRVVCGYAFHYSCRRRRCVVAGSFVL